MNAHPIESIRVRRVPVDFSKSSVGLPEVSESTVIKDNIVAMIPDKKLLDDPCAIYRLGTFLSLVSPEEWNWPIVGQDSKDSKAPTTFEVRTDRKIVAVRHRELGRPKFGVARRTGGRPDPSLPRLEPKNVAPPPGSRGVNVVCSSLDSRRVTSDTTMTDIADFIKANPNCVAIMRSTGGATMSWWLGLCCCPLKL